MLQQLIHEAQPQVSFFVARVQLHALFSVGLAQPVGLVLDVGEGSVGEIYRQLILGEFLGLLSQSDGLSIGVDGLLEVVLLQKRVA